MSQAGKFFVLRTDKDVNFTGAIVQNAAAFENLVLPSSVGAGGPSNLVVVGIDVLADQNLDWEVWFFATTTAAISADLDTDSFRGLVELPGATSRQIAAAGTFHYHAALGQSPQFLAANGGIQNGLIFYEDEDYFTHEQAGSRSQLHVALVNRSAAAKNAGAAGEVVLQFYLAETLGW